MRALSWVVAAGAGLVVLASVTRTGKSAPLSVVAAPGGTVKGSIKFVGTAPPNPGLDMSEETKCAAK
jgi:hypothetical protein